MGRRRPVGHVRCGDWIVPALTRRRTLYLLDELQEKSHGTRKELSGPRGESSTRGWHGGRHDAAHLGRTYATERPTAVDPDRSGAHEVDGRHSTSDLARLWLD